MRCEFNLKLLTVHNSFFDTSVTITRNRERNPKMFELSAERVAALLKTDLKTMKEETKKHGVRANRLAKTSEVKRDFD